MLGLHQVLSAASESVLSARPHAEVVAATRDAERQLGDLSDSALRERSDGLRERVRRETPDAPGVRIEAFAMVCEALRRSRQIRLHDVQLLAASALSQGAIAEMQTGEGKTFASAPAAYLHALTGRGVHVATPNQYLARRDHDALRPAYALLGIPVALLPEQQGTPADKRAAYRCDVTYGTGYEFGFDYLRDQLALRQAARRTLGTTTLQTLAGAGAASASLVQRELYYSIVDEADNVLLDDAASPMLLSASADGEAGDAEVHRQAKAVLGELVAGEHYEVESGSARIRLTDSGVAWIHRFADRLAIERMQRTWIEYVEQALNAAMLRRDVHYVVSSDGQVQIVDAGTGRIFTDRTWRDGLHQAVQAKEDVPITPENQALAQITRQRFSRLYERLAGMTGTASGCEREFRQVYRLGVVSIPLRTASRREIWPPRFFVNERLKWNAIASSTEEIHRQRRPVLIGTASIADSEQLARLLSDRGMEFQLLNGRQDAEEAAVVADAGQLGAVTIATGVAGRGTDIQLGPGVSDRGGLHVVLSECNDSVRVDRQMIGRCARQGDPGSAQTFVSADDALLRRHGRWLIPSLRRHAGEDGESTFDFSRQLLRIQQAAERAAYSARCTLLRRDLSRDSLFSRRSLDS